MAYLPPLIGKKNRRCVRCGLQCAADKPACNHCASLNDAELAQLLERVKEEHRSHNALGLILLLLTVLIAIGLIF